MGNEGEGEDKKLFRCYCYNYCHAPWHTKHIPFWVLPTYMYYVPILYLLWHFLVFLSLVTWFWLYVHHNHRKCFVFFLPIFVNNYVSTYCAIKKFFVTSCFFWAAWHLPITVDKCPVFDDLSIPPVRRRFYSVYTFPECVSFLFIMLHCRYVKYMFIYFLSFSISLCLPCFLCPSYHVFALLMFVCISRFCQNIFCTGPRHTVA